MDNDDTWTPAQLKAERAALRERVLEGFAIIGVVLVLVALVLTASGCASERFLSEEQDAAMREHCAQGCRVVPLPIWNQIKEFFEQLLKPETRMPT